MEEENETNNPIMLLLKKVIYSDRHWIVKIFLGGALFVFACFVTLMKAVYDKNPRM